jgi:stage V sporulation protein R
MINVKKIPNLAKLEDACLRWGDKFGLMLPEIRFFVVSQEEFRSLIEKGVFPSSPANIWEGKNVISSRLRSQKGLDRSIYYEVVQTGDPSYAYLNDGNSDTTNASVMAHVLGHCDFSIRNVVKSCEKDRTEKVIFLTNKVRQAENRMGKKSYIQYWNSAASLLPLIRPESQFNLENTVEVVSVISETVTKVEPAKSEDSFLYHSDALYSIFGEGRSEETIKEMKVKMERRNEMDRKGYRLKAPCEDIMGFIQNYAPASKYERCILQYLYETNRHGETIRKTQIMDEGWAMTWQKNIMLELFREGLVTDMVSECKTFAGVCYPRPFYSRNPYHLGYHMWQDIMELYSKGKISAEYVNEKSREAKDNWNKPPGGDPYDYIKHLCSTISDYEFLRRFLTDQQIVDYKLNKVHMSQQRAVRDLKINRIEQPWIYLEPEGIKEKMLNVFKHWHRPRVYIIDDDYKGEGALLLYHRDDGIDNLRESYIKPTMKNLARIWKRSVLLMTPDVDGGETVENGKGGHLYRMSNGEIEKSTIDSYPDFDEVKKKMLNGTKPYQN